ncbi:MarR family winged helix-turn-helix transcriptional regulator [Liquorilactobacillus uvarum]|uniref:MarR family winged helix-turn-helix transcriptional regulator n=2 Tax=Liquorilactobacillus uvarum TaxID=303240 RepID=UPI00288B2A78|nr:MarR family transcriptional regulator [Liquorilactobacillus uvarum]
MGLSLDNCTYFATNRLARETEKIAIKAYQPTGLAPTYNYILMTINELKSINLQDLSQLMGIAPSTMSRFIKKLEIEGLVKKEYGWRKLDLQLTDKGVRFMPSVYKCFDQLGILMSSYFHEPDAKEKFVELINNKFTLFEEKNDE